MSQKPRVMFLVWAPYSPRSENLSRRLNADIYMISYKFKRKIYAPIKYTVLFVKTVRILRNERPDVAICQTPPIFCALAVFMYNFIYSRKIKVIVDAHSQTFRNPWSYFKVLTKIIIRNSHLVLVSNLEIENKVRSLYGIKTLVLEDMIPQFENHKINTNYSHKETFFNIAVISSFAQDEPICSVLETASELPNIFFYMTGDNSKVPKSVVREKPANVSFTGFLEYEKYIALLHFVDAIMVLTNSEETLLSGAYDAVSSEKPLISFTSKPIRRYFSKGTIYVNNSPAEIKEAIKEVQAKKLFLTEDMRQLKTQRIIEWEQKIQSFKSLIMDLG